MTSLQLVNDFQQAVIAAAVEIEDKFNLYSGTFQSNKSLSCLAHRTNSCVFTQQDLVSNNSLNYCLEGS